MQMLKRFNLILFLSLFFFIACKSSFKSDLQVFESNEYLPKSTFVKEEIFSVAPGIIWKKFTNSSFPLTYHIVELDAKNELLEIISSPLLISEKNNDGKSDEKNEIFFSGESTLSFSKRTKSKVAINATPFSYVGNNKISGVLDSRRISTGIIMEDGKILSPKNERYAAIYFNKKNEGTIIESQSVKIKEDAILALGGFWQILDDGKLCGSFLEKNDSRTAIGLGDGKIFILVVEGEKKAWSVGLSFKQCAMILQELGALDSLELDGGQSSTLVINGENVLGYECFEKNVNNLGFRLKS